MILIFILMRDSMIVVKSAEPDAPLALAELAEAEAVPQAA